MSKTVALTGGTHPCVPSYERDPAPVSVQRACFGIAYLLIVRNLPHDILCCIACVPRVSLQVDHLVKLHSEVCILFKYATQYSNRH